MSRARGVTAPGSFRKGVIMRIPLILMFSAAAMWGQTANPDGVMNAFTDRALAEQVTRLKTDDRIAMYQTMIGVKPEELHYQNLLAGTYIQKMRETTDYGYLDRAAQIL